jgi:hypothetical protein
MGFCGGITGGFAAVPTLTTLGRQLKNDSTFGSSVRSPSAEAMNV